MIIYYCLKCDKTLVTITDYEDNPPNLVVTCDCGNNIQPQETEKEE